MRSWVTLVFVLHPSHSNEKSRVSAMHLVMFKADLLIILQISAKALNLYQIYTSKSNYFTLLGIATGAFSFGKVPSACLLEFSAPGKFLKVKTCVFLQISVRQKPKHACFWLWRAPPPPFLGFVTNQRNAGSSETCQLETTEAGKTSTQKKLPDQ